MDGLTVYASVETAYSFGTNAWVTATNTLAQSTGDRFAISTSWYNPVGTSNDWMISPAVSITAGAWLSWKGYTPDVNFPDGYEVKISTTTNATASFTTNLYSTSGEAQAWTSHYVDLAPYVGQTVYFAWRNNSNDKFLLLMDDISVFVPTTNDVSATGITMNDYYVTGGNHNVTGTIYNNGATTITSVDLTYTVNGGAPNTQTLTGISIAPFSTYNFSAATPLMVSNPTEYNLKAWTSNPNGGVDPDLSNDTTGKPVHGITAVPWKNVVFEEATGTWCGWCPRGAVFMDSLAHLFPVSAMLIAVHNGDPMTVTAYDAAVSAQIGGYPSGIVDRKDIDVDPSTFITEYNARKNDVVPLSTTTTSVYNSSTNSLDITVSALLATDFTSADMHFNAVVTEDHVTGTGTTWDQHNYYSFQSNNLPLSGAGHNWQNEPNPILAANMEYSHVGRALMDGFNGAASPLPSVLTAGNTYTKTYSYPIPGGQNYNNMRVIGMVIDYNGVILNASRADMMAGVKEVSTTSLKLNLYPNPTTDGKANLRVRFAQIGEATMEVVDVTGRIVLSNSSNVNADEYIYPINLSGLASGVYTVRISQNGQSTSARLVLE